MYEPAHERHGGAFGQTAPALSSLTRWTSLPGYARWCLHRTFTWSDSTSYSHQIAVCETRRYLPPHQPPPRQPSHNCRCNLSFGTPTPIATDRLNDTRAAGIHGPGFSNGYFKRMSLFARNARGIYE